MERDADIYSRARAISTDEEVLRIWQSIGLAERLEDDMLAERTTSFVDGGQKPMITVVPGSRGHGHAPQSFIYQPALEQVLRDGVDRYDSVHVRLNHDALKVRDIGDEVELLLHDVVADRLVHERARYVIAADGGSSPTRGSLGIGFDGRTFEDRWVVIDTKVLRPWPQYDHLRFHCDPARPAVDCPTPLDHHRWEFPILPGEDEAALVSDVGVWALLGRQGITSEDVEILRAVVYSHHVRFASQWRRGRVFLAGDAAHVMPPWIGQGMAAGVRDAANLSWKLDAVLSGSLDESVLDTYETERQPHVREVTRRAVTVGRFITMRRARAAIARDALMRGVGRWSRLSEWTQRQLWIPDAHYAESFSAGENRSAEGHKIPQPHVATSDGPSILLDDALPAGWVVLHTGPAPRVDHWRRAGASVVEVIPDGTGSDGDGTIVDTEGVVHRWLSDHGTTAVVLRPDRFTYAAASDRSLPEPPCRIPPAP